MITSDEKMVLEMSRSAHIMWKLFKQRCSDIDTLVRREVSTQHVRYEHLGQDPRSREQRISSLIIERQDSDKIAGNYLAAFDRYNGAMTAFGVATQLHHQRRIIELLERLEEPTARGRVMSPDAT
jgi:hypothetical protein